MSKQTGALVKEARTAAGMTQKELTSKVEGLSASTLGKAERGEKELTPKQLDAIAEVTGVAPEALMAEEPAAKALTDEEILELYKSADPDTKKAAVSVLKGEKPQGGDMMSMFAGMMGGQGAEGGAGDSSEQAKAYFANIMGGQGTGGEGAEGEGGQNPMAGMMSMFSGMMGGQGGSNKEEASKEADKENDKQD